MARDPWRAEGGQTTAEYMGLLVVVAAIVLAVGSLGLWDRLGGQVVREVCLLVNEDRFCPRSEFEGGERAARSGPRDSDGDGLSDRRERELGTLPGRRDSDEDGVLDGDEVRRGLRPREPDSDFDGLSDGREVRVAAQRNGIVAPDPARGDQDEDRLSDAQELALGTWPDNPDHDRGVGNDSALGDGLSDFEEVYRYGSDPTLRDTDEDGTFDGEEVARGTDPVVDERSLPAKALPLLGGLLLEDPLGLGRGGVARKLDDAARGIAGQIDRVGRRVVGKADEALSAAQRNVRRATQRRAVAENGAQATRRATATRDVEQARDWRIRPRGSGTTELRKRFKNKVPGLRPPKGMAAHHLVPKGAYGNRSRLAQRRLYAAQAKMRRLGISPDDTANGVFVEQKIHAASHTDEYFRVLNNRLRRVTSKEEAAVVLRQLGREVRQGKFSAKKQDSRP